MNSKGAVVAIALMFNVGAAILRLSARKSASVSP